MALEKARGRRIEKGELAVVVGAGRSGLAAVELLSRKGARVRLLDRNPRVLTPAQRSAMEKKGVELLFGEHKAAHFTDAAFVIPSPGMPVAELSRYLGDAAAAPRHDGPEILAEMELAWRFLAEEPVLAVTGTSGKTTTASLAASMLQAQGYAVFLGGNIGTPLSEYVLMESRADVVVVEISSFQLQACSTFCPRVGILLNLAPNHLDYHRDMREYTEAKFRLFRCQSEGDLAVLGAGLKSIASSFNLRARTVWIDDAVERFPKSRLLGVHNRFNVEAAWQACRFFGVSEENAARAVARFKPLPHRLEAVLERDGVLYVNDSKCTTVSALEAALSAFDRPVRLLCGGRFKGGDLASLTALLREKVAEVALFGASRETFEQAWQGVVPMHWHAGLAEAVDALAAGARAGDVVLLSPATASYDLYESYKARGDDFKRIVRALQ